MASLDYNRGHASRRDVAVALAAILFVIACLAVVGHVEATSLDPRTDCYYGQIRTADGSCR